MLLYAGQFVVTRWSIQRTLSLWDLAALRFTVAGLLLLPLVLRLGIRDAAGVGWGRALLLATAAGAPYTLVLFAGLTFAPAAHGAVIIPGLTPVIALALGWWWFGERPSAVTAVGLAAIVAGLVLVGWPSLGGGDGVWLGDVLLIVAGVLWALFTALARRWRVDPVRGTAMVWVIALAYVPVYGLLAGDRLAAAPRGEVVFLAVYQGLGVAVGALSFYAWAIRVLGASVASLFMPLIPVFGVLLGVPVLGEVPAAVQWVGIAAVSAGLIMAALRAAPG
jgi:drug/metabolite transporter (DMT)-like permease